MYGTKELTHESGVMLGGILGHKFNGVVGAVFCGTSTTPNNFAINLVFEIFCLLGAGAWIKA